MTLFLGENGQDQNDVGPTLDPSQAGFDNSNIPTFFEDTPKMAMNNNQPPATLLSNSDVASDSSTKKTATQIAMDKLRELGYSGVTGFKANKDGTWTVTIQRPQSESAKNQGQSDVSSFVDEAIGSTGAKKTTSKAVSDEEILLPFDDMEVLDPLLRAALNEIQQNNGGGSGNEFLKTETAKQDEVTRQFKDFLARAQGVYGLMDSEQQRAMRADDQNAQNMKAAREGLIVYPGDYATGSMATAYSPILAPSVPNYVLPDYRLDTAVGLNTGNEGFNNPNYTSSGTPITPPPATSTSKQPVSYMPDGTPIYGYNADGTPITEVPMLAMGTDYHAMLMRKLITGGL